MQTVIKVPILTELTPQQVLLIKMLESIKAFDIKSGSITIHFNANGQIVNIEKKEFFKI
jgi:hypothetical protein